MKEGLDLFWELASNDPSKYGYHLAFALVDQSFFFLSLGEYQKVLDSSQEAIYWLSKSSPQYKDNFPYDYAYSRWAAALAYKNLGDIEKADEYGQEAVKIINRLISDRPLLYTKDDKSTIFSSWFLTKGRPQDALNVLDESLTICCSVEALPTIQQYFADVLYEKAKILQSSGDFNDALKALSRVIDILRHLLEDDEKDSKHFMALLSALELRLSCLVSLDRQSDAVQTIDASLDTLWSLINIDLDETHKGFISDILTSQESMLMRMDDTDAVYKLREYKKALTCIGEGIREKRRRVLEGEFEHSNLAHLLDLQHEIYSQLSRFDEALLYIQESVDLRRYLARKIGTKRCRKDLVSVLICQARCLNNMQRMDDSLQALDEAMQYL